MISENELFAAWMVATGDKKLQIEDVLVKRLRSYAGKICWKVLKQNNQDIINTACWMAIRHAGRFKGESKFTTWFYAVVYNLCQSWLREKKLKGEISFDDLTQKQISELPVTEIGDRQLILKQALAGLSDEERELLEGKMSGEEDLALADKFAISHTALRVRWFRLKKKLENQLK